MGVIVVLEDELVSTLQRVFRLTRYEAQLYLALLKGASNAKEASIISGVPLPRIYDVIRVLESKGYVLRDSKGWYRAVPPRAVALAEAARLEEETRRRIRDMSNAASILEAKLVKGASREKGVYVASTMYGLLSSIQEHLEGSTILLITIYNVYTTHLSSIRMLIRDAYSLGIKNIVGVREGLKLDFGEEEQYIERLLESRCIYLDMIATNKVIAVSLYNSKEGEAYSLVSIDEDASTSLLEHLLGMLDTCR